MTESFIFLTNVSALVKISGKTQTVKEGIAATALVYVKFGVQSLRCVF